MRTYLMTGFTDILRASFRRFLVAVALASALVALATYVLLRIEAPAALVVLFAVLAGSAAVLQTLSPGTGIGARSPARRRRPKARAAVSEDPGARNR
jgi:hypothetical protein